MDGKTDGQTELKQYTPLFFETGVLLHTVTSVTSVVSQTGEFLALLKAAVDPV